MKVRLPVRRAILERQTYEVPAEGRFGKIRLDFNENTSGCGKAARKAVAELSAKKLAMYPEYEPPTKKLARYFGVRADEIVLTNGGDDALRVFFDTFVEPRSHILICEPTFPMYRYYAEIAGAKVKGAALFGNDGVPADRGAGGSERETTRAVFGESKQPHRDLGGKACDCETVESSDRDGCRFG